MVNVHLSQSIIPFPSIVEVLRDTGRHAQHVEPLSFEIGFKNGTTHFDGLSSRNVLRK
jgi:hypothetical protein